MKRTLLLMRHAKSSWSETGLSDHERSLNRRGRDDAPRMGVHLAGLGLLPARVLSSDSARTQETWEHLAPALGANTAVHFDRDLYLAGFSALSRHLCAMEDGVDCVLAIGHNPGWERTAGLLVGETVVMTTANVAVLTTDAEDWATAMRSEGDWRLIALYRPRDLR